MNGEDLFLCLFIFILIITLILQSDRLSKCENKIEILRLEVHGH